MLKNMVPNPSQFNSDQTKFKDQQREIQLFLKNNRAIVIDNKITAVLAQLRRGIAEIYTQKNIDQILEFVNFYR